MSFDALLTQTLVLERGAETRSGTGQSTLTFTDLVTVKGLIQFRSGREFVAPAQGLTDIVTHRAFMARVSTAGATYSPRQTDRLRDETGQRYEIVAVGDAAGRGHHFEADLKVVAL